MYMVFFLQLWTTIKGQSDGEEIQQDLKYYEKSSAPSDGCISGNVQSKVRAEFWHDSAIYMDGTGAAFTAFEDYCTACTAYLRRFCWDYRAGLLVCRDVFFDSVELWRDHGVVVPRCRNSA